MLPILFFMAAGIVAGLLLPSKNNNTVKNARQMLSISTGALLFFMGFWMGVNPAFWESLYTVGLLGLLFALLCTGGSLAAVYILVKLFYKEKHK